MKERHLVFMVLLGLLIGQHALGFYNPSSGRWLNRDPVWEPGLQKLRDEQAKRTWNENGNLYAFVGNNSVQEIDIDGRWQSDFKDPPWYDAPSVPTGIFLCYSAGKTARPYDHAWIQGDGWGAGFWPGGDTKPEWNSKDRGRVAYPDDPYYLSPDKSHSQCGEWKLWKCCDVGKFKRCVMDKIRADQSNPPWYHALKFNCGAWATGVLGQCMAKSCL